jgi:hypothetical protein
MGVEVTRPGSVMHEAIMRTTSIFERSCRHGVERSAISLKQSVLEILSNIVATLGLPREHTMLLAIVSRRWLATPLPSTRDKLIECPAVIHAGMIKITRKVSQGITTRLQAPHSTAFSMRI